MAGHDTEFPQFERFAVVEESGNIRQYTLRKDFLTTREASNWITKTFGEDPRRLCRVGICGVREDKSLTLPLF